jgi:hypothetical protein
MQQAGILDRLGEDNVCGNLEEAIQRATTLLQNEATRPVNG